MSIARDGLYAFAARSLQRPISDLRNWMIARKLGVKQIRIGPGANLRGLSCVQMGENFLALEGLWLEAITRYSDQHFLPRIVIGDRVQASQWVHIAATHYVEIGDDVLIGSKVMITDHNHGQYSAEHTPPRIPPAMRPLDRDRSTIIGRNVWLGDGVVVAPGSCVGEGCVVGANSVVTGNIPAGSICAGVPAKVIKTYDEQDQRWHRVRDREFQR